ncbi:MAG: hypothetical protein JNJ58_01585 [Chitinophagaceae bacterium]|nr:hypothetical protein [Chitinophagaceae bacterium]
MPLRLLIVCYLTACLWTSCTDTQPKRDIDVSGVPVKINSVRFDRELFACDTLQIENSVNALGNKYPDFASVYFNEITGFSQQGNDPVFYQSVRHFLTYKDYRALFDTVFKKYPDVKDIDAELKTLFQHVKYYFPDQHPGDVYYFISGLNFWSAVTIDSAVGVGLDMYLGKDYPFYASVQLPQYQIDRCEKQYIPVNVSRVIYENMKPFEPDGKTLLDMMIQKGKQMVFLEYTLPKADDALLMGYTPAQLKWCQDNEGMIWNYFSKQKLLYATHWQDIMRYVNDGPNSTGMPAESPGNIGSWIGWQIVRKYLSEHPEVNWNKMVLENKDAQQFLSASKYKPR